MILIDNGVKYSSGSRNIRDLDVLGDDALVKVRDEGEGISQEDLNHIFERFYRTDNACTVMIKVIWNWLSHLKQIVDAYNQS